MELNTNNQMLENNLLLEILNSKIEVYEKEHNKYLNVLNKINLLIDNFPKNSIFDFSEDDVEFLLGNVYKSHDNEMIISVLKSLLIELEKPNKNLIIPNEESIELLEEIKKKTESHKKFIASKLESTMVLNDYNLIYDKLIGSNDDFIEATEITIILNLLKEKGINTSLIIESISTIDKLNMLKLNNKKVANAPSDEEIIFIDEDENNFVNSKEIHELFKNYGIDFANMQYSNRIKLLKHGDIDRIRTMLEFISSHEEFKFFLQLQNYEDHFVNVLIVSSPEIFKETKKTLMEFNIPMELYRINPNCFYPKHEIRSKHKTGPSTGGHSKVSNTAGISNTFKGVFEIFEKYGVEAQELWDHYYMISKSPSLLIPILELLESYGVEISADLPDSIVCTSCDMLAKRLDEFVEIGLYDYIVDNLTLAKDNHINTSTIKYVWKKLKNTPKAELTNDDLKIYNPMTQTFKPFRGRGIMGEFDKNKPEKNYIYPTNEEAEKLYGKVVYKSDEEELYTELMEQNLNKKIDILATDSVIELLDEKFRDSENEYLINGIIISRNKVVRNYNYITHDSGDIKFTMSDLLMYVITFNSLLNQQEIDIIQQRINELELDDKDKKKILGGKQ